MDRHDIPESVTAENVAQLHQQDLRIQHHFNCKALTYWYDENRKTAFCLIDAPDKKSVLEMHNQAHGQVPNSIIEVDPIIVESFLGRINDPEKGKHEALNLINNSAFRIIMVIQLSRNGFVADQNDFKNISLNNFRKSLLKLLLKYEGSLVKQNETYFLISFNNAANAVNAAFKIQDSFSKVIYQSKNEIGIKIGLSAGVPLTDKKSLFESAIQFAERMCNTINGEIVIASAVNDLYNSTTSKAPIKNKKVFPLTKADEDFLNRLIDYMEANSANPIMLVNDLCKAIGYSKSGLYRRLNFLTAQSPNRFINEFRLNKALILLERNENNITEVAYQTGFSSPSYFSKCFKNRFKILPSTVSRLKKDAAID